HRFAISRRGSGSHLMAHVLGDRLGFTVADDRFVEVGDLDGARRAIGNGEAELFLWDRFMTAPLVTSGEFGRIGVQPTPWPAFVVAVHNDVLAGGRSVEVANLLDTAAEAAATFCEDPDAAVAQVVDAHGLSETDARDWFDATEFDEGEPADEDDMVEIAEQLVELGLIDAAPGAEDLVVPL
ncbi:MAG: ABC transporter substrate-binding protein, partial [Acidimicrobiales bacterium]